MKHLSFEEDEELNRPTKNKKVVAPKKESNFKPTVALRSGINWEGDGLEVTSEVYAEPVKDWDTLLIELGYDPNLYEVIEPVKVSAWDAQGEDGMKRLYSYKAGVRAKRTTQYRDEDYQEVVSLIKKHRPLKDFAEGDCTFFVFLADWQIGKADGDGTSGTVKRILTMIDDVSNRIDELLKMGRKIERIVIVGVGDMNENCEGHYASQLFTVELNRRQQMRLLRRLLTKAITTWAKKVGKVEVYAVPGNHGENRGQSGKANTTRGDNDDVSVFEMVYEILQANPSAYGHVEFYLPEDEIYMIIPAYNRSVGVAHGHVTSGGANPQNKIRDWWKDQAFCKNDIGYVDILVTGHYHHFSVVEYDDQTIHFQCPAMDGGSEWFKDLKGVDSRPGTLTFIMDGSEKPYRDLEII